MSTEPNGGTEDGQVVQLRAHDAGTETRTAESPGPAYADLSDGREQRKPIIPAHWRPRAAPRRHLSLAAARHGHAAAYHGVRAPRYLLVGAGRRGPDRRPAAGLVARAGLDPAGAAGRRGRAAVRSPAHSQGGPG